MHFFESAEPPICCDAHGGPAGPLAKALWYNNNYMSQEKVTNMGISKKSAAPHLGCSPDTWAVQLFKMCKKQLSKPLAENCCATESRFQVN